MKKIIFNLVIGTLLVIVLNSCVVSNNSRKDYFGYSKPKEVKVEQKAIPDIRDTLQQENSAEKESPKTVINNYYIDGAPLYPNQVRPWWDRSFDNYYPSNSQVNVYVVDRWSYGYGWGWSYPSYYDSWYNYNTWFNYYPWYTQWDYYRMGYNPGWYYYPDWYYYSYYSHHHHYNNWGYEPNYYPNPERKKVENTVRTFGPSRGNVGDYEKVTPVKNSGTRKSRRSDQKSTTVSDDNKPNTNPSRFYTPSDDNSSNSNKKSNNSDLPKKEYKEPASNPPRDSERVRDDSPSRSSERSTSSPSSPSRESGSNSNSNSNNSSGSSERPSRRTK